ncbi:DUF4157 domain-containing protein [Streptomyces sp. G1]|uniref:eCIS core domain-containing protein n=1 Tax=Streptomyces sp. G1 TaxID=361572 RepID=UPI00202FC451|nr:DUF4157 domain-containing protein [Streptomyces sp. G1]MCM1965100.1 DUF4157 domain-containing protein [Streptomyces sp. G1]
MNGPQPPPSDTLLGVIAASAGGGRPLDPVERRALERSFGADLADVRIHTGRLADRLCRVLRADACTRGSDVFLGSAARARPYGELRGILVHELAHVLQQRAAGRPPHPPSRLVVSRDPALEREADLAAARVARGLPAWPDGREGPRHVPAGAACVLQPHSSWEHRLLGDLSVEDMRKIARPDPEEAEELQKGLNASAAERDAVLEAQLQLMLHAKSGPAGLTMEAFRSGYSPLLPLEITSKIDGKLTTLAVSFGELTTLGDYFQNPAAIERLEGSGPLVERVIQNVRWESYNSINRFRNPNARQKDFEDAIMNGIHWRDRLGKGLTELYRLQTLTALYGTTATDDYLSLLSRNACHFAPYSWYRWQQFHREAREYAMTAYKADQGSPEKAENTRMALLWAGYADHFLQDSFASGHLVNKTLLMQWYLEWAAPKTSVGLKKLIQDFGKFGPVMTEAGQPGLAPNALYEMPSPAELNGSLLKEPWWRDPQTVSELPDLAQRRTASGVRAWGEAKDVDTAYQAYMRFMQSPAIQLASGEMHDHFCKEGLLVRDGTKGRPYKIYGDKHMLKSGTGMVNGCKASWLARTAITELLGQGKTTTDGTSIAEIFKLFPVTVHDRKAGEMTLREWHDQQVKKLAMDEVFGRASVGGFFGRWLSSRSKESLLFDYERGAFSRRDVNDYLPDGRGRVELKSWSAIDPDAPQQGESLRILYGAPSNKSGAGQREQT